MGRSTVLIFLKVLAMVVLASFPFPAVLAQLAFGVLVSCLIWVKVFLYCIYFSFDIF